ncbi:MAG TPA: cyclic nucleotide-binding domain-containing protein, partial [Gemmatimonadaceae bacterium]|nr:cyclic nucleotide-binding domain-containing protein [Gemmatimonadaceae bacterium]
MTGVSAGDRTRRDVAFPQLGERDIATLAHSATRRHLRDGESLFQAGASRGGFFVVLSGAVEIVDRNGSEPRPVAVHEPGEFTGDIDILSRRRPVVSAVARGDSELLDVPPSEIRRIIGEQSTLGERILRAFTARRALLLDSGFEGLRVIGSGGSRDASRIREFLTRNQVPVTWIDTDEDAVGLRRHLG